MATKAATATKTSKSKTLATTNGSNVKEHEDLSTQIQTLRADLAELASTVRDTTRQKASETATTVKDKASVQAEQAKQTYEEYTAKAEKNIRENPLTSVAIAVGAGLVLGAITRR